MGFKFGSSDVDNVMFGSQQVDKIYRGETLVWQNEVVIAEYDFTSGAQGWFANIVWDSGNGVGDSPCLKYTSGYSVTAWSPALNFEPATYKVEFDIYQDSNGNIGGLTDVIVTWDTVSDNISAGLGDQWNHYIATITQTKNYSDPIHIQINRGGDYGYTWLDNVKITKV